MKNDVKSGNTAGRNQSTLEDSDGSTDLNRLSNKELLSKCKEYGREALQWKWKFAGLLPEVSRRGLWKEAGFASVFHFAKVLAGMSEAQVKQALRLERKFENMPKLKVLFESGSVSPNKLDRIGSVVNEENEEELAQVVQMHSKQAVATLVRDVQRQSLPGQSMTGTHVGTVATGTEGNQTLHDPVGDIAATHGLPGIAARLGRDGQNPREAGAAMCELQLSQELKSRLLKLKAKGFDVNARTKRVLKEEYGTKCSIETCSKPAQELHHTRRFALAPNNNPKFLAPLCRAHHELAARVDVRYLEHKVHRVKILQT